ncbi:MAG: cytochrome d ubiquinol oxidase subunit II [Rhodoferax sp.]|jgi:cytochrome d ubiquinol oxidase subunit II
MLMAFTLRSVAFDFRVKAKAEHKPLWDRAFYTGSLLAGWSQGDMLGGLITGFKDELASHLFSALIGLCLVAAYCLLGAGWLIMKTEGLLHLNWLHSVGLPCALG